MIRYAKAADHAAIETVTTAAFGKPDEAALIARLRVDEDVMFELVAEDAGEIVGHILFSRLWADRPDLYAALAPVSVLPARQNAGHGSSLIRSGLDCVREFGAHGVLVLGHPAYYPRFGFSAETAATVRSVYAGSPAFMALALEEHAFAAPLSVTYPDAFSA